MRFPVNQAKNKFIEFRNTLLVPNLSTTLISIPTLAHHGLNTLFDIKGGHIIQNQRILITAKYEHGLYRLPSSPQTSEFASALVASAAHQSTSIDINILHRRMGHASEDRLRRMVKHGQLDGIKTVTGKLQFCEPCILGKMKKLPFQPHAHRQTSSPFELIHTDLGGPISPQTPSGFKYWMIFVDDYTRYPWICFLKHKSEALDRIRRLYHDIQAHFKQKIGNIHLCEGYRQTLHSDGGGEFTGNDVERFLRSEGIFHETSAAYTQEQNGLAERMNQTVRNNATAMLIDSKLPRTYWSEAMMTAVHLIARTPAAGLNGETPQERMFGAKVDPLVLRPFGCTAYALIPKQTHGSKFEDNARKCVLLGYQSGQKAYRLLDPETKQIFSSRHVIFNETSDQVPDVRNIKDIDPEGKRDWGGLLWHQRELTHMPTRPPQLAAAPTTPDDRDDDDSLSPTTSGAPNPLLDGQGVGRFRLMGAGTVVREGGLGSGWRLCSTAARGHSVHK
jgi:transposase InsO family protein